MWLRHTAGKIGIVLLVVAALVLLFRWGQRAPLGLPAGSGPSEPPASSLPQRAAPGSRDPAGTGPADEEARTEGSGGGSQTGLAAVDLWDGLRTEAGHAFRPRAIPAEDLRQRPQYPALRTALAGRLEACLKQVEKYSNLASMEANRQPRTLESMKAASRWEQLTLQSAARAAAFQAASEALQGKGTLPVEILPYDTQTYFERCAGIGKWEAFNEEGDLRGYIEYVVVPWNEIWIFYFSEEWNPHIIELLSLHREEIRSANARFRSSPR